MSATGSGNSADLCDRHPYRNEPCIECDFPALESTGGHLLSVNAKQLILKRSSGHCELNIGCQCNWANRFHIRVPELQAAAASIDTPVAALHICDRCEWWIDNSSTDKAARMGWSMPRRRYPDNTPRTSAYVSYLLRDKPVTWRGAPVWLFDDGALELVRNPSIRTKGTL